MNQFNVKISAKYYVWLDIQWTNSLSFVHIFALGIFFIFTVSSANVRHNFQNKYCIAP